LGSRGELQGQRGRCASGEFVLHRRYKGLEKKFFEWLGVATGFSVSGIDSIHAAVDQVIYRKVPVPLPTFECLTASICLRQETAQHFFGGGDDGHDFFFGVLVHWQERLLPLVVNEYQHWEQPWPHFGNKVNPIETATPVVTGPLRQKCENQWNAKQRATVEAQKGQGPRGWGCTSKAQKELCPGGKKENIPVAAGRLRQNFPDNKNSQGKTATEARRCCQPLAWKFQARRKRQQKWWGAPAAGVWELGPNRIWSWRGRNSQGCPF